MISNELLSILKCPETGSPLQLAEDQLVSKVNSAIDEERARDRLEQKVLEQVEGGLTTDEQTWMYPIRDGIPTLVLEEAIDLNSI